MKKKIFKTLGHIDLNYFEGNGFKQHYVDEGEHNKKL